MQISPVVQKQVISHLQEVTGTSKIEDDMSLSKDLNMDSLAIVELITWLESEYGYSNIEVDSLVSVRDVLLAASGTAVSTSEKTSYKVSEKWFKNLPDPNRPDQLKNMTITEAFLYQARRQPNAAAIADQTSGILKYRDMVLAIMLLRKQFAKLEGKYIGIMLPASVAVSIVYLAVLFAGKIPVMINWTLGKRNLQYGLNSLNIRHIITAQALLSRISAQGFALDEFNDCFIKLEQLWHF
jgi:acyl carrier protein